MRARHPTGSSARSQTSQRIAGGAASAAVTVTGAVAIAVAGTRQLPPARVEWLAACAETLHPLAGRPLRVAKVHGFLSRQWGDDRRTVGPERDSASDPGDVIMSRLLGHRPSPALRVATLAVTTIASS